MSKHDFILVKWNHTTEQLAVRISDIRYVEPNQYEGKCNIEFNDGSKLANVQESATSVQTKMGLFNL